MMHVLAVALGPDCARALAEALPNQRGGAQAEWAENLADCRRRLAHGQHYDVVVADCAVTAGGDDVLALFQHERPDVPVYVVTEVEREAAAQEAIERGAADYVLIRQESQDRLMRAMTRTLEQARNRRMVIRQTSLLKALLAVSQQIAAASELAPILASVVHEAQVHLRYEYVAAYLRDGEWLALCAVAGVEPARLPSSIYRLPLREGTPGRAVLANRAIAIAQFSTLIDARPALGLGGISSELSVPIRDGDHAIGAIMVASRRPGQFGLEDERTLSLLAEPLTAALRGIGAFQREQERAMREHLLARVSSAVNSTLDLQEVLGQAVAEIGSVLKVDICALSQVDLAAGTLSTEHEYVNIFLAERRSLKKMASINASLKPLMRWLQMGQVVTSSVDQVDPALADWWRETSARFGAKAVAWVPIRTQTSERFYALMLMQVTHQRRWTDDDLKLLRGIAGQLSLTLRNAQLYETAQHAAAQLRAKNAELEAFVYTVSHDLQAPVVSMRGFASLLQSRHAGQLDERGSLYVDRIAANAEFLNRLLNDLLELSRVGRLEEPDEDLPVADIVREVIDDLAEPTQAAGVTIRQPEYWPQVRFSRVRLRQVWSNLLSNAIKFLGQQTAPRVEVGWRILPQDVDLEREDTPATIWAEFWVRDNGIGIHPEYQQRIFRPFQRLKVVEVDGTGVGLSIVRRIVEGRGGTVRVESAPGQGATFYFTAPLSEASGALRGEVLHVATGTPHFVD